MHALIQYIIFNPLKDFQWVENYISGEHSGLDLHGLLTTSSGMIGLDISS